MAKKNARKKKIDPDGRERPRGQSNLLHFPDHKLFAVWITDRDAEAIDLCNERWHATSVNNLLLLAILSMEFACKSRTFSGMIVDERVTHLVQACVEQIRDDGAMSGRRTTFQIHESYFAKIDNAVKHFGLTGRPEFARLVFRLAGDQKI